MNSNKPYLIRALREWICDNDCTPYIYVNTDTPELSAPAHLLADNPLILNASPNACKSLSLDNHAISFQARFNGEVHDVYLPIDSIIAILARENGQGMTFEWEELSDDSDGDSDIHEKTQKTEEKNNTQKKSSLKVIR